MEQSPTGDYRITSPIVAIGASAGGLEAVSEFLEALPSCSTLSFVVVQHLDPNHESLLTEILRKRTRMSVLTIENDRVIEQGRVYVLPPNASVTVSGDRFRLIARLPGKHHPVDTIFQSLAENLGDASIGIVMSGGDSDGSLGVRAIKNCGGVTFAQEPASAQFPSMPVSAINTGCIDYILKPADMACELERLSVHPYLRGSLDSRVTIDGLISSNEDQLRRIFRKLRAAHGVDFSSYKRSTLRRRLARRMALRQLEDLSDYVAVVEDDPAEAAALHQDFLIRVTSFFRDAAVFETLSQRVFPALCEGRPANDPIRIWVAGCASGEEVYSIAIALVEFLGDRLSSIGVQIFGTDVSEVEIEKARAGYYLANIAGEVSTERLQRFFVPEQQHYRIARSIRDLCIFARQDITRDPPFSRLDLVSCRNLLIYLDARAQRRVMQLFHYSLRAAGRLILGPSETVGGAADLFDLIDREHRLYGRKAGALYAGEHSAREFRPAVPSKSAEQGSDFSSADQDSEQLQTDRLLLARYAPATLLVDADLNILQYRGETGRFVEHASGLPSHNLRRVVRPELMVELAPALIEAKATGLGVRKEGLALDELTNVSLEIVPLNSTHTPGSVVIIFEDASPRGSSRRAFPAQALHESDKDRRLIQLEREMSSTRDYLQATIEEQEAVQEELKSAHEEVLSANEEFQSTNEELETAKEELQSTNEELTTTNDELRDRNRELSLLNSELEKARGVAQLARVYADSIIDTVRDPLLVLDVTLKVLRANPAYYQHFESGTVSIESRPFSTLGAGQWSDPKLIERLRGTFVETLTDYELEFVEPSKTRRLRFSARKIVGEPARDLILLVIQDVTSTSRRSE